MEATRFWCKFTPKQILWDDKASLLLNQMMIG